MVGGPGIGLPLFCSWFRAILTQLYNVCSSLVFPTLWYYLSFFDTLWTVLIPSGGRAHGNKSRDSVAGNGSQSLVVSYFIDDGCYISSVCPSVRKICLHQRNNEWFLLVIFMGYVIRCVVWIFFYYLVWIQVSLMENL